MSRIGKLPITIPENVDINYNESEITVKGKFGALQTTIPDITGDINFICEFIEEIISAIRSLRRSFTR